MKELKNKTVIVTGASGFIGSHLTDRLVSEGARVHALFYDERELWRLRDSHGKAILHKIDIMQFGKLNKLVAAIKPDKIFHLAAIVNVSRDKSALNELFLSNIKGTINMLRALRNIRYSCFINTGTCEEYGDNPVPFMENQIPNPVSPYSASKAANTLLCHMLYKTNKLPIVTLRPFLTYGPRQYPTMLIPDIICSALQGKKFKMTKGEQSREVNYIDDIVEGFILASVNEKALGEVINIGCGREMKIKDIVKYILELMGNPIKPGVGAIPYRAGEAMHFYCDNSKAKNILRWKPRISMEKGLKETIKWYELNYEKVIK